MHNKLGVSEITKFLSKKRITYTVKGNVKVEVESYCQLARVSSGHILWIKNWTSDIFNTLEQYKNLIVVCKNDINVNSDNNCYVLCAEPKMVFFELLEQFYTEKMQRSGISKTAVVETKKVGKNCYIGEFSVIGTDVEIGDNVIIEHHVIIEGKVKIGDRCIIHSGCIIGKPGFGYYTTIEGHYKQVPHVGGVVIGTETEIGANCCIDCGTLGNTEIGNYVKIDNMCHIAHNVFIGDDAMVIAMSLLGGSCCIEKNAYIAPGALIMNQKNVGKNSFVGMGAVVVKDVPHGKVVAGVPAKVIRDNE